MFKDFINKFRETVKQQKTENGTWGWDDEKKLYSKDPNGGVNYRKFTVVNGDDKSEKNIVVSYDKDGKISSAGFMNGKEMPERTYGGDALVNFFKNNFDMDASNYVVLADDVDREDPNTASVVFDSVRDGRFTPSTAFKNADGVVQYNIRRTPTLDGEMPGDFYDEYRKMRLKYDTLENDRFYSEVPEQIAEPAYNGSREAIDISPDAMPKTMEEWQFINKNRSAFKDMLDRFSSEPNKAKRIQILDNAAPIFSGSGRLLRYLDKIRDLEENADESEYDYRLVAPDVNEALDIVTNATFRKA